MSELPQEVEAAFYANALSTLADEVFLELIDQHLPSLSNCLDADEQHWLKQYQANKDYPKARKELAHSLWGKYIDLRRLDFLREAQIIEQNEQFIQIDDLIAVNAWLSGGTSIEYVGVDKMKYVLSVEFPYTKLRHRPCCVTGAVYYQHKLVPFGSALEKEVLNALAVYKENDHFEDLAALMDFLFSEEYLTVAKKLGRIEA